MGASIVMEWIRAIEECLLCELPGGVKDNKMTLLFKVNNNRKYLIFSWNKTKTKIQEGLISCPTRSLHPSLLFILTVAPSGRCGSDVQRSFPSVFVLTGLDVYEGGGVSGG